MLWIVSPARLAGPEQKPEVVVPTHEATGPLPQPQEVAAAAARKP